MKRLFIDYETTFQVDDKGRTDPSPFDPRNYLVSCGFIKDVDGEIIDRKYYPYAHNEWGVNPVAKAITQDALNWADEIIAYNLKFEMLWSLETDHHIPPNKSLHDPMIVEYVMARGRKWPMDMGSCAERNGVTGKKKNLVDAYWKRGIGCENIPWEVLQEYGLQDVDTLREIYTVQQSKLKLEENRGLLRTIQLSHEFLWCIIDMERRGIYIDADALREIELEYDAEYKSLKFDLERIAKASLGGTAFNLNSVEHLSQLIYSRKVNNKERWAQIFNIGTELRGAVVKPKRRPRMSSAEFIQHVRDNTAPIRKTRADHCEVCGGKGLVHRTKKDGSPFKKPSHCADCQGRGYRLVDLPEWAGFRLSPSGSNDAAQGGFSTDGDTLERLKYKAKGEAREFIEKLIRYNQVDTYRSTFVEGIKRGRRENGLLHTQLMQIITATGRLSSVRPNFQNIPRGNTFPVKKAIVSRWKDGKIVEVDFAKLEYCAAVYLGQDKVGMQDIENDVDAHTLTAQILTAAGQPTERQEAKPKTFRPLYGGQSGTPAEIEYNIWFKDKHYGITAWQDANKQKVLETGILTTPTGREFAFTGTVRTRSGYISNSTSICNYPVQSFATADMVPVTIIELRKTLNARSDLKSCIILTVHDSIVFDVYPGEEAAVLDVIHSVFSKLPYLMLERYGIRLNVPFGWEVKGGINWLKMKELQKDNGKEALRTFLEQSKNRAS